MSAASGRVKPRLVTRQARRAKRASSTFRAAVTANARRSPTFAFVSSSAVFILPCATYSRTAERMCFGSVRPQNVVSHTSP